MAGGKTEGFGGLRSLGRVLVVDDHAAARESVIDVLRQAGYAVEGMASAVEALVRLEKSAVDVVITDLQMPGLDGLAFIRQIVERRLPVQMIMVTAHATISSAVEAMRLGAFDYMEKPFDVNRLERLVAQAMERRRLCDPEAGGGPLGASSAAADLGMVGESAAMRALRQRIAAVAPTDETVLICGESGTGKELVAQAVHALSRRASGPLVSLNCPALSPQLAESELFGHRRGAFTGADTDRTGRFELARGGAILLDEITEIEPAMQSKLLRVLQERTFEPVGSSETCTADVRVMASTNRDLRAEIAAGRFREDLYYRLAVVPLELPPLRERGADALLLAEHFLERAARRLNRKRLELSSDARELLLAYHWPGNVRELENLITRACVLNGSGAIAAEEICPWLQQPEGVSMRPSVARSQANSARDAEAAAALAAGAMRIEDMEREMIVATLERFAGNRARTAEALGIGVWTLSGKLRQYGFAPRTKEFRTAAVSTERQLAPMPAAESADPLLRSAC